MPHMHSRGCRLVESLRPFPGMQHLDVAGGTGDVAFRVLRAIRQVGAVLRDIRKVDAEVSCFQGFLDWPSSPLSRL